MKKIIYLAALLLTALGFTTSCKDDPDEFAQQATNANKLKAKANGPQAEYTICFYGCAGGNLDDDIIMEMLDNSKNIVSTNGKVRVVGIYKPAKDAMAELGENGGARYFEIKYKDGVDAKKADKDWNRIVDEKDSVKRRSIAVKAFYEDFVNEKYGDSDLRLYAPSNMAQAFKFLTEMAPAKKYILMTNNHGGGWSLADDKPYKAQTRAMVFDDTFDDKGISLDQLNEGVKQSGVKFDVLFCNLCLMGTLENLYGYSENFPICIASAEVTQSCYYGRLATRLAQIGGDVTHDQLFQQCSQWVTTTDTAAMNGVRDWKTMNELDSKLINHQDFGCYDLTKIGNITTPLRNISSWYIKSMADSKLKNIIQKSVLTTLYTAMPDAFNKENSYNRGYAIDALKSKYGQNITADGLADLILQGKGEEMYKLLFYNKDKKVTNYYDRQDNMTDGFPMAYFVWNTIRIAKQQNDTKTAGELQSLFDSYMTALKSMSQIQCDYYDYKGSKFDGVDYPAMDPYLWTSPTVTIASFHKYGFLDAAMIDYSPWVSNKKLELGQAIATYNNTKFDQLTNWSKFLQQLEYNPNVITNTWHNLPVYYSKFSK